MSFFKKCKCPFKKAQISYQKAQTSRAGPDLIIRRQLINLQLVERGNYFNKNEN